MSGNCTRECQDALGMKTGAIPEAHITASSELNESHAAVQGRLNSKAGGGKKGAWSPCCNDTKPWLQIDLGNQSTKVTVVATQGGNDYHHPQWVTKYKLQYSNDGDKFCDYNDHGQSGSKEFDGNTDPDTVVYHQLGDAIKARYIRFLPNDWHGNNISMRVNVFGCQETGEGMDWTYSDDNSPKAGLSSTSVQEKKTSAIMQMELENTSASPAGDPSLNRLTQRHEQIPMLRSMQASEQMIYDVYANTMGMIEELEKHEEHHQSVGYSERFSQFPKGYKKPKRDVQALIEAELTCLKVQVMSAPREAKEKAIERLLENTVMWLADREENKIDRGLVDEYAANVVQILKEESMTLPERVKGQETNLGGRAIIDVVFKFGEAQHKGKLQDEDFKKHPEKKAAMHKMRQGKRKEEGQKRLKTLENPDLK